MDNYLLYALRQDGVRLTHSDKWLVLDDASPRDTPEYIVYFHRYGAKRNRVLYQGTSMEDAVNALLQDNDAWTIEKQQDQRNKMDKWLEDALSEQS